MVLVLSLIGLLSHLTAQQTNLTFSPDLKGGDDLDFEKHLLSNDSFHYLLFSETKYSDMEIGQVKRSAKTPQLVCLDKSLNPVYSKKYRVDPNTSNLEGFYYTNGEFLLITSFENLKEKKVTVKGSFIGMNGEKRENNNLVVLNYEDPNDKPEIGVTFSPDSSKFIISAWSVDKALHEKKSVHLACLDKKLIPLWESQYDLEYSKRQARFLNHTMSNDGLFFIMAKVNEANNSTEAKREDGSLVSAYDMKIFQFSSISEKPIEIKINLEKKFVRSPFLRISQDNKSLSCVGFYSENKEGDIMGVFYSRLNILTGEIAHSNLRKFSPQEIAIIGNKVLDSEYIEEDGLILEDTYVIKNVIGQPDGGIIVLAEEAFVKHKLEMSSSLSKVPIYHNYDIVVFKVNMVGMFEWLKIVPKKQIIGYNPICSSFDGMESGQSICLMYNDEKENLTLPLDAEHKKISSFKNCIAALAVIDGSGEVKRKELFGADDVKLRTLFVPSSARMLNEEELLFVVKRFNPDVGGKMRVGLARL